MTSDDLRPNDFRHRADAVRAIPLQAVLSSWGAERDRRDKSQWRTGRGPLSITGTKFFNWNRQEGGGGAIDLVMHLSGWDVAVAVEWLEQHLGSGPADVPATANAPRNTCSRPSSPCSDAGTKPGSCLRLPVPSLANLQRVHRYLTNNRGLHPSILQPLIDAGKVYADRRGNAVFVMVTGKVNRPIGAELRGTGRRVWRGLAPGTRKDDGYFWIGPVSSEKAAGSQGIVLCESAIDAISCFQLHAAQLHGACICISTAGVRPDPPWLRPLMARNYDIYCGFDDDEAGNAASCQMITRHRSIQRLRPPAHDWNDALTATR